MDGWYALTLSIIKNYSPDTSMSIIETGRKTAGAKPDADEILQMIEMRDRGHTWAEIGKEFNNDPRNCFAKVKRYRMRQGGNHEHC